MALAQRDVTERWRFYEQMAGVERDRPGTATATKSANLEDAS